MIQGSVDSSLDISYLDTTGTMTVNGVGHTQVKHTHERTRVQHGWHVKSDVEEDGVEKITNEYFLPDEEEIDGRHAVEGVAFTTPEPNSWILLGIGGIVFGAAYRARPRLALQ